MNVITVPIERLVDILRTSALSYSINPYLQIAELKYAIKEIINYICGDICQDELNRGPTYQLLIAAGYSTDMAREIMAEACLAISTLIESALNDRFVITQYQHLYDNQDEHLLIVSKCDGEGFVEAKEYILDRVDAIKRTSDTPLNLVQFAGMCAEAWKELNQLTR